MRRWIIISLLASLLVFLPTNKILAASWMLPHVIRTCSDDDTGVTEDEDDPVTTDDEPTNNELNENEEETENAPANNVDQTVARLTNETDTTKARLTAQQAEQIEQDPNTLKTHADPEYVASNDNHAWVPYWFWWTMVQHHQAQTMPKHHDANVKTNQCVVDRYQRYLHRCDVGSALGLIGLGVLFLIALVLCVRCYKRTALRKMK